MKASVPPDQHSESKIAIPMSAHNKRALFFQKTGLFYYDGCQLIRQVFLNYHYVHAAKRIPVSKATRIQNSYSG
jgi:hypothetical protein